MSEPSIPNLEPLETPKGKQKQKTTLAVNSIEEINLNGSVIKVVVSQDVPQGVIIFTNPDGSCYTIE